MAALAAAALLTLTACGGGDAAKPQVASIPTHNASAPATGGTSGTDAGGESATNAGGRNADADRANRPQMRLDDTPARRKALINAWNECLARHGARWSKATLENWSKTGPKGPLRSVEDPVPQSAKNACTGRLPLGPPELDPSRNPKYRDDMLAQLRCMKKRGMHVRLVADTSVHANGLSWNYDGSEKTVGDGDEQIAKACELEAFKGK
ncbi:hypothetical protein [Streptomyces sp. NBC_00878]|uniref:hypothetical protein n=1 Tax=Streptomyces sp. NBC_00878 TaxID=2975854 RepID=UPI00225BDF0B|nr:hypothetical protein [Streptomyces sp. NBC_00878]MCX4906916.1 hypothetical protein [Streptomyces sp. NBC_00878]